MRALKPCGTIAAHGRHVRHGEDPCEDCAQAVGQYQAAYHAARTEARKILKELHPVEYEALRSKYTGSNGWQNTMLELSRLFAEEYRELLAALKAGGS